jgi:hypothetical protein
MGVEARMSSKTARRRREFVERERKRRAAVERTKPWTCRCGHACPAWTPICLCGILRESNDGTVK